MVAIENLYFNYKKKPVFHELSIRFKAGHVYGLLGKNGTGKSTLLHNIAGLLFPEQGTIRVNGFLPAERSPQFLKNVVMVPEEFYLPDIEIAAFLKYQAPFYPHFSHAQFQNYCKAFDIPVSSTMQRMSYGQKKKVLISFALATNAALLLMDEPTNGLDIMSKSQFRKVLAEAFDEHRCIIISTHQVKDLENLIDHVTIIDEGKILFDADMEDIANKLAFRLVFDEHDTGDALYKESSLRGYAVVTPNYDAYESRIDLELLYKAIITNGKKIKSLFQP